MVGFGGFGEILTTFYWDGSSEPNAGLFRPVSLLLFAAEWQMFENNPGIFHFVRTVLYALVSMQLFLFLGSLFKGQSITLPFLANLIWIVIPIHTQVAAKLRAILLIKVGKRMLLLRLLLNLPKFFRYAYLLYA